MSTGTIKKIAGPLVVATGMRDANMSDVVHVGEKNLIGEIIEIHGDQASIQVYEETAGLAPGAPVTSTGMPMSVELGPGLISSIYDGIQRPLDDIMKVTHSNLLQRGVQVPSLKREKLWHFVPSAKAGDVVTGGDILGSVQETHIVNHKIMVHPSVKKATVKSITEGDYHVTDTVAVLTDESGKEIPVTLMQKWPVRKGRPYRQKLAPTMPLITGQRVIDTLFPIAKGGTAAVPGPFGSGKTVVQHQLAKWADADIVVYIGCGERGNEMTDVLNEFPELKDPRSGYSLMERTVLIANTSDMPVAAREASIYTGITIAEYFRDMGYSVALMADSTSRWAEALREMSGRLEEMPGEEGYPAYLGSRLAQFYERAGRVETLGTQSREGALSVIGAVSPAGGDLDAQLAYERHFPAINWLTSYSLYQDSLKAWFGENAGSDWEKKRAQMMLILHEESQLKEMVQLVGEDALSAPDRLKMETARSIREDYLHQNAFHETDTYTSLAKQYRMMGLILDLHNACNDALAKGADIAKLVSLPVREQIGRYKYTQEADGEAEYQKIEDEIASEVSAAAEQKEEF